MDTDLRAKRLMMLAAAVSVAFALSVPISGTLGIIGNVNAPPVESVLKMGFLQGVDSLNPYIGLSDVAYIFYGLVYDQLQAAGDDMERVPNLAKEVRAVPTDDPEMIISGEPYGSVWEFNITQNAVWTDGEPFTADDVVFNLNLNADNYPSMWAYQPVTYWMKEAVKIDEDTVRVHFYNRATGDPMPAAYGEWLSVPMLPKHLLETIDPFDISFNWTGLFEGVDPPLVGTGMFMATSDIESEWYAGDHITLVRNPNYHWAADYGKSVRFDKILMKFYDDATALSFALRTGAVDVAPLPPQAYHVLAQDVGSGSVEKVTAFQGPRPDQYFTEVGINMNNAGPNPSRLDHTIRLAMAMATNKTYIAEQYYLGTAMPGSTLVSSVSPWHYEPTGSEIIDYDIVAANALLESSGYVDTDFDDIRECTASSYAVLDGLVPEGTKLTYQMLVRREAPEEKDIAMYLKDRWAQAGIDVMIMVVDEVTLSTIVYSYAYDTMIWYWSSDPDPNYILFTQSRAAWAGWSDNKYSNESFEENYTASVAEMDAGQRGVYVDNCQRIHYEDVGYIILAYLNQTVGWRTDTFSGWGDWLAHPGRTILNMWSANPLYFDLVPILPPNEPPTNLIIDVAPDPATVLEYVAINVSAVDMDGDALLFYIEFGDGNASTAVGRAGFNDPQFADFSHAYSEAGTYTITVWVNDSTGLPGHNASTSRTVLVEELIPEFSTVLLPLAGLAAIVLVIGRRRRNRGTAS